MRTTRARTVAALAALVLAGCSGASSSLTVQTESGPVAGSTSAGVSSWLGIPYAAAPVGALRWKPPAPAPSWSAVRDATRFGPACPQVHPEALEWSEDCLTLNVWAPAREGGEALPVMVFVHGGGWAMGSGSQDWYEGAPLARRGVVVVTLNYRLGALGFLAHPALTAESAHGSSGNYGLLDQAAALGWVRRNVAAFGGDPSRVTVFGESAGGTSVLAHLVAPGSRGLFQRAIVQSGPLLPDGPTLPVFQPLAAAEAYGATFVRGLGVVEGPGFLDRLRQVSVEAMLRASPIYGESSFQWAVALRFKPITDGWVIVEEPVATFRKGLVTTPFIIGTDSDEGRSLAANAGKTVATYRDFVLERFPGRGDRILSWYPASTDAEVQHQLERIMTDFDFDAAARLAAASSPSAWAYRFSYPSPGYGMGAFHGSELFYVFRSVHIPPDGSSERVSDAVMELWTGFARTGVPGQGTGFEWPRHTPATGAYLDLGAIPVVKVGY